MKQRPAGNWRKLGLANYLEPDAALAEIERARMLDVRVLGLDGLILFEGSTQATHHIADFSSSTNGSHDDAIAFIESTRTQVTHYDLVLDD